MKVAEYIPEAILILEVASRSRPDRVVHYLSVVYDEEGDVADIVCSCEAALYGKRCHHVSSMKDLIGVEP